MSSTVNFNIDRNIRLILRSDIFPKISAPEGTPGKVSASPVTPTAHSPTTQNNDEATFQSGRRNFGYPQRLESGRTDRHCSPHQHGQEAEPR